MKLGLQLGYWGAQPPDGVGELVAAAEDSGFDAVFAAEAWGSDAFTPLTWWGSAGGARSPTTARTTRCRTPARGPSASASR